ncbi:hypothetical protein OJJOAM_000978 [Cupriavidus sp. H18C1]|uniref:hypothetical protein n=1 Tax=Cupriavidus sp. H18C1 TaxID=3241601 RepID=UPI003BB8A1BA
MEEQYSDEEMREMQYGPGIQLSGRELYSLQPLGPELFHLYVLGLRSGMDAKTGVVQMAYSTLKMKTRREPRPGVGGVTYDRPKMRRMLAVLEEVGLIHSFDGGAEIAVRCVHAELDGDGDSAGGPGARVMASYRINDAELDALSGEGADLFQLYVGAIRPRMDYKTGVVGRRVRLSYQALKEWTERAGRSGVRFLAHDKSKIQRMLARLEHLGLLRKVGRRGDLVFACPLADTDSHDQKQADTESIQVDRPVKPKPRKASRDLSTRRKNRQADTHQVTGKTLNPSPPTPLTPAARWGWRD